MKFSEIQEQSWDELKPYMDTCLLPVTGLSGREAPWEAAMELERLRDALDLIEIPFKGRVVTYPAMHFTVSGEGTAAETLLLNQVCSKLKADSGFRFVVIVTAKPEQLLMLPREGIDLIFRFTPEDLRTSLADAKLRAAAQMTLLWSGVQGM